MIAPLFKLTVRDPGHGVYDGEAAKASKPGLGEVLSLLLRKPAFWLISVAAACSSMMGYGLFFWLPSYLVRSFDVSILEASLYYGSILLVGGIAGIWLGGVLGDRLGAASRSAYALIPAVAFVVTIPFYIFGLLAGNLNMAIALLLVPTALGMVWLGPILSTIQHLVPSNMRATASAIFLFINNLIGIGLGTLAIGWLSDGLAQHFGKEALRYSILAGTGFYVAAALLLFKASRVLDRDWHTPEAS
jgi:sugar phosphate permease